MLLDTCGEGKEHLALGDLRRVSDDSSGSWQEQRGLLPRRAPPLLQVGTAVLWLWHGNSQKSPSSQPAAG